MMTAKTTQNSKSPYHAYLLRIWQENDLSPGGSAWRFSLEDAQAGTRRGFADLESLHVFLNDLTFTVPGVTGPAE
jgi:hypothetical protein